MTTVLDVPCPFGDCRACPGEACRLAQPFERTPRQWEREVDGQWHRARVRAAARHNARVAKKRGYSREFKPHGDTGKRYLLDRIPAGLWSEVKAKCKREGVSVRALILKLLKDWLEK